MNCVQILVSFMKKRKLAHESAGNGLIAVESYKERHARYRLILMGKLCLSPVRETKETIERFD
jgi:hypothetical protein